MRLPTIHLNGTSAEQLLEQAREANLALHHAIMALENMNINARDYYPQGPEAYVEAAREHAHRLDVLSKVRLEVSEYVKHILDLQDARRR